MAVDTRDQSLWVARDNTLPELLAGGSDGSSAIRAEIQNSWRRCAMTGLTPAISEIPYEQNLPRDSRLRRAAEPVVNRLAEQLLDSPATILLADSSARIIDRRAGSSALRARLDSAQVAPGFGYSEEDSGTNGIGSALEERRLFSVRGGEHFRESLQNLACVGKPIIHPLGRAVEGILDITCAVGDASELMAPLVHAAVREIEQRLYEMASRDERAMLEEFLRTSRRGGSAVVTLSSDLIMANPAASRLLQPGDKALLWNWACLRLEKRDEFAGEVQLASKRDVLAKVRRLGDGKRTMGVVVELRTKPVRAGPRTRRAPSRPRRATVPLPGRAPATRALDADLDAVAQTPGPTLVTGDHGVGKRYAATVLHHRWCAESAEAGDFAEPALIDIDLALPAVAGARRRMAEVAERLASGATVMLRHVDALDDTDTDALVAVVQHANETSGRLVVTGPVVPSPKVARVHAHFVRRLEVTPLSTRAEEIEDIANVVLAARSAPRSPQRLQAATLQSLMARSWPGNVRELVSVIESAASRALGGDIGLQHLPAGYRDARPSRAHSALERAELETLLAVLKECGGNKSLAAERLGVARSTLYRKVRQYGIDCDRFVDP